MTYLRVSEALLDGDDLVWQKAVRLLVNVYRRLCARRLDEAVDRAGVLVEPPAQVAHVASGLSFKVCVVRIDDVLHRRTFVDVLVNIHE